jgi:Ion channel
MTQASPARRLGRRTSRGHTGPSGQSGRYGALLLVLIATYLLSAFSGTKLAIQVEIGLFVVVLLLALRTSPLPGRWPVLIGAVALAGSAGALAASLTGTETGAGVAELWKGLMLLFTAVLVVRRVLSRPVVDLQSIYGALSAYLITGLMFAAFYAAVDHLTHAPFFADNQPATTQTFQYFSFVTLTTLGYGDFTAAENGGRALAVIEALAGQVFLATLVARLVSAYRTPARQAGTASRRPPRSVRYGPGTIHRGKAQADARGPAGRSSGRPARRPPRSGG